MAPPSGWKRALMNGVSLGVPGETLDSVSPGRREVDITVVAVRATRGHRIDAWQQRPQIASRGHHLVGHGRASRPKVPDWAALVQPEPQRLTIAAALTAQRNVSVHVPSNEHDKPERGRVLRARCIGRANQQRSDGRAGQFGGCRVGNERTRRTAPDRRRWRRRGARRGDHCEQKHACNQPTCRWSQRGSLNHGLDCPACV